MNGNTNEDVSRTSNPVLSKDVLIELLNQDLSSKLAAIARSESFAAKASGPQRDELAQFFLTDAQEEKRQALRLASRIVELGGRPTEVADPVLEVEGNREMVEAVLEAERETMSRLTERVESAQALGDASLAVELDSLAMEDAIHAVETERFLRDWPASN